MLLHQSQGIEGGETGGFAALLDRKAFASRPVNASPV
jgi:hypothetical protein